MVRLQNFLAELSSLFLFSTFREHKVFRVYVILPLLPAFEGDVGGTTGKSLIIVDYNR